MISSQADRLAITNIESSHYFSSWPSPDLMTPGPVHVDTDENNADSFTKILARGPFGMVHYRIMLEYNIHHGEYSKAAQDPACAQVQ